VLPLDFLRLPVVAVAGLALYGEPIEALTMLGAALIFAGNYWSVRAETRAGFAPSIAPAVAPTRPGR
jgi:drug/metabolite transporter (DMT)-like permease